ncbi:MAG: hypothetical protein HC904_15870 [Blastochloris sp.]|nr:hypothetical protein [Blastochloris sp.]
MIPLTTMQSVFKAANVVGGVDQGPDIQLTEIQVGLKRVEDAVDGLELVNNVLLQTHRGYSGFSVDL